MIEISIKAGLIEENDDKLLFFELQSEAASLYSSKTKILKIHILI